MKQLTRGFTIIELAVVIMVISILFLVTATIYNGVQETAKLEGAKEQFLSMSRVINRYKADNGSYPNATSVFADNYIIQLDRSLFLETANNNIIYCTNTAAPYTTYAVLGITRTNKQIYISTATDNKAEEYTGGITWGNVSPTVACQSVLPSASSAGTPGFRLTGSPAGWQNWIQ